MPRTFWWEVFAGFYGIQAILFQLGNSLNSSNYLCLFSFRRRHGLCVSLKQISMEGVAPYDDA
jgi:hypothetical protein